MNESALKVFKRWLSDGTTWIGVFENKDLSSLDVGRRIALPFDTSMLDTAKIGETRGPEVLRLHGAIPWQYILVAVCYTAEEALAEIPDGEHKPRPK